VAVLVGVLVAGGAHIFHEWRFPVYGPPGQPAQSVWLNVGTFALFGAVVGLLVGFLFVFVGQAMNRVLGKAVPP